MPPAPCSMGEPKLPVPLPSHYYCWPGGAARVLRGEAAGSGWGAGFAGSDSKYMVKKNIHITFSWLNKPHSVCYWLWMMEINWASKVCLILPMHAGVNCLQSSPGACHSGRAVLSVHISVYEELISCGVGVDMIEILADSGAVWLIDFLLERLQSFRNTASIWVEAGIHPWPGQSHCELSLNMGARRRAKHWNV